jgi:hypothetical protein
MEPAVLFRVFCIGMSVFSGYLTVKGVVMFVKAYRIEKRIKALPEHYQEWVNHKPGYLREIYLEMYEKEIEQQIRDN